MTDPMSPLNDEEVRQIAQLVETLDKSSFDFLELQVGNIKVTLGKGEPPRSNSGTHAAPAPVAAPVAQPQAQPAPAAPAPAAAPAAKQAASRAPDGTVPIASPMMGMFYAQAEPGAPPFVKVGDEVREDTTIALIEVMKTFTAVPAGVRGVVTEICVENAQLVEYGQALFRVRAA